MTSDASDGGRPLPLTTITAMTPMSADGPGTGLAPVDPFVMAWRHRRLLKALVRRDIEIRYRGSLLGAVWLAGLPLALMVAYTFAFGYVFKSRLVANGGMAESALAIFVSITVYQIFSETINRCASLLVDNRSYVKKVAFPLRAFVWVPFLGSIATSGIGLLLFVPAFALLVGMPSWTWLLVPFALIPFFMFTLGCGYFFAALGAPMRDIKYVAALSGTILLFMSPVFYRAESMPASARLFAQFNPLYWTFEGLRSLLFYGQVPNLWPLAAGAVVSAVTLWVGYLVFTRMQSGFSDVL
jgi:lipopolysaccharide transport system permease protein